MSSDGSHADPAVAEAYKKRLAELQAKQQAEEQARMLLKTVLDSQAFERLGNVKLSNPQLYAQVVQVIAYLYQNKQIAGKMDDGQLKQILAKFLSHRRETTIRRI